MDVKSAADSAAMHISGKIDGINVSRKVLDADGQFAGKLSVLLDAIVLVLTSEVAVKLRNGAATLNTLSQRLQLSLTTYSKQNIGFGLILKIIQIMG